MNKRKLPKVIVCLDDEARSATSRSANDASGQQSSGAHDNALPNMTVSEPQSPATDKVVEMIRPAGSPDCESIMPHAPHLAVGSARRRSKAHAIVNRYSAYSAVGGLAPLAVVNFAGITALIVRMVKLLCKHYGVPFQHDRARAMVIGLVGGAVPTGAAAITTSTLLSIAPPTAVLGMAVSSVTAAIFTRSVGRVFIEHFEQGASLHDLSAGPG